MKTINALLDTTLQENACLVVAICDCTRRLKLHPKTAIYVELYSKIASPKLLTLQVSQYHSNAVRLPKWLHI
jgi:hypothetical protein